MHSRRMTVEGYYNSRMVVDPLRLFDCCLITDSGRAFIVTTAERARELKNPPVLVMGMGQSHPAWDITFSQTMTGPTGAKVAGETAFKMAGITTKDVDAAEIYDCFTNTAEISLIDYGFFKKGEGEAFFADGRTGPGGEFPVNTSGGLLSEVYNMGFSPMSEGVIQLMGQAGERQIKDPKIILVSGNGGTLMTHSTTILRRGDL